MPWNWKMTRVNARKIVAFAIGLAMLVLSGWFAGCERTSQPTPARDGKPHYWCCLAFDGTIRGIVWRPEWQKGLNWLAKKLIRRHSGDVSLEFIIEDNKSTVEGMVEAFNKLIQQDGVSVIIGPATSSALQAALPLAQENQIGRDESHCGGPRSGGVERFCVSHRAHNRCAAYKRHPGDA